MMILGGTRFVAQEPERKTSLRVKIGAVAAVIIVIAALWVISILLTPAPVTIVAVDVQVAGYPLSTFHTGFTLSLRQNFTYSFQFPFTYPDNESLVSMNVNTLGFKLKSVNPSLPYELAANSSVTFTATLMAPDTSYNGPLTFTFATNP